MTDEMIALRSMLKNGTDADLPVVAGEAFFLDTEDLAPSVGLVEDEGGAVLLRPDRDAGVVLG